MVRYSPADLNPFWIFFWILSWIHFWMIPEILPKITPAERSQSQELLDSFLNSFLSFSWILAWILFWVLHLQKTNAHLGIQRPHSGSLPGKCAHARKVPKYKIFVQVSSTLFQQVTLPLSAAVPKTELLPEHPKLNYDSKWLKSFRFEVT